MLEWMKDQPKPRTDKTKNAAPAKAIDANAAPAEAVDAAAAEDSAAVTAWSLSELDYVSSVSGGESHLERQRLPH